MRAASLPFAALRDAAVVALREGLGVGPSEAELEEYRQPVGDPGLFGPGSLVWRVHADLPVMLIGGFSALMLQTLHPLAMARVADHSRYREDPLGRFQRTARYVAGTSFGGMPLVEELIGTVKRVHVHVQGVTSDGRAYSAGDPDLVTWVHTTEMWSILRSYQRYSLRPLLAEEKDRYLAEVAVLGERLGGREIPERVSSVRSYFRAVHPALSATPAAKEAVAFLRQPLGTSRSDQMAHRIISAAAIELMPTWARQLLGLRLWPPSSAGIVPVAGPLLTRAAALSLAGVLRNVVGPSLVHAAATARVHASAA